VTVTNRSRLWPVFAGFAGAIVAMQVVSAVVFTAWAWATMAPGGGSNALVARLTELTATVPGLAVAAMISATVLGAVALLGALLSPEPWRRRLRLTTAGATAGRVALVVVGVLAVSHALDSCIVLLGLQRFGALDHLNRVMARASGGMLALLALAVALGPGVAEELFFRGYMQTRLVQRLGTASAIAATAACFGLIHFDLVHTPVAAILGVFLGWATERTGSIVPAMVAHVVNNLVAVVTARLHLPGSAAAQGAILAGMLILVALATLALSRTSARSATA
jgi:membrane protease YdiL (CAAX protease family)